MSNEPAKQAARRTLRIVSKCSTTQEFIEVFRHLCDGSGVFIATGKPKPTGTAVHFNITLEDGTSMIAGTGTVGASHTVRENPWGRPGMRIEFGELSSESHETLEVLKPAIEVIKKERKKRSTVLPPPARGSAPQPLPKKPAFAVPKVIPPVKGEKKTDEGWEEEDEEEEADTELGVPEVAAEELDPQAASSESPGLVMGERAKGSDYILPANPFGELAESSLEAFIECTLYEETGNLEIGGQGESQRSLTAPPWWPETKETPRPDLAPKSIPPEIEELDADLEELIEDANRESSPEPPAPPTIPAPPVLPGDPGLAGDPSASPAVYPRPRTPIPTAPGPVAAAAAPVAAAAAPALPETPPAYRAPTPTAMIDTGWSTTRMALAVVLASAFTMIVGYAMWGGSDDSTTAAASAGVSASPALAATAAPETDDAVVAVADASVAAADIVPDPVPAIETEADAGPVAETDAAPGTETEPQAATATNAIADSDICLANLTSRPAGASVRLGRKKLGVTPLQTEIPCGEHSLVFRRARYVPTTVKVSATAGSPVDERAVLKRPTFTLRVLSRPSKATVYVGGRRVGKTPRRVKLQGYERTRVKVVKKGYVMWSRSIYMKKKTKTVLATLKRAKRKSTKRTRKRKR